MKLNKKYTMEEFEDVTDKYYAMLDSFRADNALKVMEIQHNEIAYGESYFDIEKRLIKNKDERLMKDIELLEELEFNLRHNNLRIVRIDKDSDKND